MICATFIIFEYFTINALDLYGTNFTNNINSKSNILPHQNIKDVIIWYKS
jgi:hypothetical protein